MKPTVRSQSWAEAYEASIRAFCRLLGMHACVHVVSGELDSLFANTFTQHTNPFCTAAKQPPGNSKRCMDCDINLVQAKLGEGAEPFLKLCHCGVWEAVIPIKRERSLSGVLFIGPFMPDDEDFVYPRVLRQKRSRGERNEMGIERTRLPRLTDSQFHDLIHAARFLVADLERIAASVVPDQDSNGHKQRIADFLYRSFSRSITLSDLAWHLALSESRASQLVRSYFGTTFPRVLTQVRLDRARDLLTNSYLTVSVIARETGFLDQAYFHRVFRVHEKMTPLDYRKKTRASAHRLLEA